MSKVGVDSDLSRGIKSVEVSSEFVSFQEERGWVTLLAILLWGFFIPYFHCGLFVLCLFLLIQVDPLRPYVPECVRFHQNSVNQAGDGPVRSEVGEPLANPAVLQAAEWSICFVVHTLIALPAIFCQKLPWGNWWDAYSLYVSAKTVLWAAKSEFGCSFSAVLIASCSVSFLMMWCDVMETAHYVHDGEKDEMTTHTWLWIELSCWERDVHCKIRKDSNHKQTKKTERCWLHILSDRCLCTYFLPRFLLCSHVSGSLLVSALFKALFDLQVRPLTCCWVLFTCVCSERIVSFATCNSFSN